MRDPLLVIVKSRTASLGKEPALALVRSFGLLPVRAVQVELRISEYDGSREERLRQLRVAAEDARRRNPVLQSIQISATP
eukprot:tig00000093_g3463.t1